MAKGNAKQKRRVCFVTGTRAEFGLMATTLQAVRDHAALELQIVVTGMHLDPAHGDGLKAIRRQGWKVDAVTPWRRSSGSSRCFNACNTGYAMAGLAKAFERLGSDIVLVLGDRVEAFAAAAAAHVGGQIVAHVHGGDRAMGQVDDAMRHAITKMAHVHFPATRDSARRIARMGEDGWRIHGVGSPGVDGIVEAAAEQEEIADEFPGLSPRRYALVLLHPVDGDCELERKRAAGVLRGVRSVPFEKIVIVYPNNDPGCRGIIDCWESAAGRERVVVRRDVRRDVFLGLLRDAAVLVGNSSSGIIEAASFGTPVLDVGWRQLGRERSGNVVNVDYSPVKIAQRLEQIWSGGNVRRSRAKNVYGAGRAGYNIAEILATMPMDERMRPKLIAY